QLLCTQLANGSWQCTGPTGTYLIPGTGIPSAPATIPNLGNVMAGSNPADYNIWKKIVELLKQRILNAPKVPPSAPGLIVRVPTGGLANGFAFTAMANPDLKLAIEDCLRDAAGYCAAGLGINPFTLPKY